MTAERVYVTIGKFGRARGVRGEIWITPVTNNSERFLALMEVYVAPRHDGRSRDDWQSSVDWQPLKIEQARIIGGRPVLKLESINTPEEAARYTNRAIAIPREMMTPPSDDSHYVFDLVGCAVIDEASGETVGELIDVHQYPANDVYVIRSLAGSEVLFPAVKDFVKHIDVAAKRITVNWVAIADLG